MAGSSNFKVFNPNLTNMMDDTTYNTSSYRLNGAVSGLAPSNIHNKLYYQATTMISAIAEILADRDFAVSDSNYAALKAVLVNGFLDQGKSIQEYTTAGTFTFTAPKTGKYKVTVIGGGGGGGGAKNSATIYAAGGGGGGGGHAIKYVNLTAGQNVTVTVGSGGNGGIGAVAGSNGSASSFGAYCSATGGGGGNYGDGSTATNNYYGVGGIPGGGTGGDINGYGSNGYIPTITNPTSLTTGGNSGPGGSSYLSGGAATANNGNGLNGILGSGGSGADATTSVIGTYTGGNGGVGTIIIEW